MRNYYARQYYLSWILGHYFYDQTHYSWVAAPFFPHNSNNPRSSNPLRLYEETYSAWKEQDPFSDAWDVIRAKLRKGIESNVSRLSKSEQRKLTTIIDDVDIRYFYPVVYRVDVDRIPVARLNDQFGSANERDSIEYRIADLQEDEFDILFLDFETEPLLQSDAVFQRFYLDRRQLNRADVLHLLQLQLQ